MIFIDTSSLRGKALSWILLSFFLAFQSVLAQASGTIKGKVADSQTGEPLIGANVVIQNTSLGAAADIEGKFNIRNIPVGKWTLKVSYIGYVPVTQEVTVTENATLEQEFRLRAQALTGETVVITAQARGQKAAINQQIASNTISNIVSQARIKELPDVNAAESIGRLPGVSIERSGGEATRVSIRGLSAKYNTVTVNGVVVPATGGDDRSVDLSLISSNMLDGIEVKKANTPDMDADALGGTVDLKLREAPDELQVGASVQGGYNKLQKYYGNYNFRGNASNRFFDGDLGVIATVNIDNYDRSADKFSGNYREIQEKGVTGIAVNDISLREEKVNRGRTGASILLDFRIPYGKATVNSFYNRLRWDGLYRINRMNVNDNRHYYDLEDRDGTTSIFTGAVEMKQDFDWIRYDFSVARTASRTSNPNDRTWTFVQENGSFVGVGNDTPPNKVAGKATLDTNNTAFSSLYIYDTKRDENQTSVQLNIQMPYNLGDLASGYIKIGGKFRWLDRMNDENQYGRDGFQYGNTTAISQSLAALLQSASQRYPNEFDWIKDSTLVRDSGVLPISRFFSNYTRSDFLGGEYPLGFVVNEGSMNKLTDALQGTSQWLRYAVGSRGRDYDGIERYQAYYIMTELNFGEAFTFLPGIRYEKNFSRYHGQRYREVTLNNIQAEPADLFLLENERKNEFWLPMVHLTVKPADWLKIRLARTETLTRPDYIQYAPITSINSYQTYIRAANSQLKPARSKNYDASVSVYENYVGLFTVSGFYKTVNDLIFQTRLKFVGKQIPVPEGLNIPNGSPQYMVVRNGDTTYADWLNNTSPDVDTYLNSPFPATYKGFELDWQTHFWYLPIFQGLVLNVNYTRIFSETQKELFFLVDGGVIPDTRPPRRYKILVDSSRTARMPDQPSHIANVTLGYDYEGFSVRLSYLYQTDKTTFISTEPILDNFSGAYARWDLTLQQKFDWGLQFFANFNNLNNRHDVNYRGNTLINPAYIEYYGFSMDVGVRYTL